MYSELPLHRVTSLDLSKIYPRAHLTSYIDVATRGGAVTVFITVASKPLQLCSTPEMLIPVAGEPAPFIIYGWCAVL